MPPHPGPAAAAGLARRGRRPCAILTRGPGGGPAAARRRPDGGPAPSRRGILVAAGREGW
jgi:hypothetical protein